MKSIFSLKTKRGILRFVKKLIRYKETQDPLGVIEIEYKRILKIQATAMYSERDIVGLHIDSQSIKQELIYKIVKEIESINAFTFTMIPNQMDAHTKFESILLIVMPK